LGDCGCFGDLLGINAKVGEEVLEEGEAGIGLFTLGFTERKPP
jgi:hypothetical protein